MGSIIVKGMLVWVLLLTLGAPFLLAYAIWNLWRPIVRLIAEWRNLKIVSYVTGNDHLFMLDKFYTHPLGALSLKSVIEGELKSEDFLERLNFLWEAGWERFSKLQPTTYMGCYFWQTVPQQLNLRCHLKIHPHGVVGPEALDKVHTLYLQQPFQRERPLWDILLLNYFPTENLPIQTVVILRVHHVLADALSVRKFFAMIVDGDKTPAPFELKESSNLMSRLEHLLLAPLAEFRILYDYIVIYSWFSREKRSRNYSFTTVSIPLQKFKLIVRNCKKEVTDLASVAAIVWTLSGALRKFLVNLTPKEIGMNFALPSLPSIKGRHEDIFNVEIGNLWNYAGMWIPIEEPSIEQRRSGSIKSCNNLVKTRRHKLSPLTNMFREKLPMLVHELLSFKYPPVVISNVPGPSEEQTILGQKIVDQTFNFGTMTSNGAVVAALYSYAGRLKVSFMLNETIMEESGCDDKRLAQLFLEEIDQVLEHVEGCSHLSANGSRESQFGLFTKA